MQCHSELNVMFPVRMSSQLKHEERDVARNPSTNASLRGSHPTFKARSKSLRKLLLFQICCFMVLQAQERAPLHACWLMDQSMT